MSDRRPENRLWKITATYGPDDDPMMWEEATVDEVLAFVRRGVESGTIKGEEEPCPRCDGNGYEVIEHIRAVPEHNPSCVGGSECASTCPVPAPHPEYEREACPACGGLGSLLVIPVSDGGSET